MTGSARREPRHRWCKVVTLTAAAALLAAACAPPGSDSDDSTESDEISTEVPDDEEIELVLAHFEEGGLGESIEQLVDEYESQHPNVTFTLQYDTFLDYGQSIRLRMSSDNPPDIAQAGQGYVMMGPLVDAGLLYPLDAYAEAYGWDERVPEGLLDQSRFLEDASGFGDGNLYGLALGGNMVGVYYNQDIADDLGLSLPLETLDDFTQAMETANDAGVLPITLGNLGGTRAGHILSILMSRYQDSDEMLEWIYGQDGADFDMPATREALDTFNGWVEAGHIPSGANGTAEEEALSDFIDGGSLFHISGNWNLADVAQGLDDAAGFMLLPPLAPDDPPRATGATTSPFGIHRDSEHRDVAANFLDFITSEEAAEVLNEGGYAPIASADTDAEETDATDVYGQFNQAFADVLAADGQTLYLDWSTATMGDTIFPVLQEFIGQNADADHVIETVQADWEAARG